MFALAFVAAYVAVPSKCHAQNLNSAAIDREVESTMRLWNVPGVALAIVGPEKTYIKGYGCREIGKSNSISADTVFPLASCTKAFTSLALGMLVDDGKLNWDDPVRKHLPDFHLADPKADSLLTVRDLLCHRTGVGGNDLLWYRAPWNQDESIRRIQKMPPRGQFRSSFAYQSIMYMVAGKIVAKYHPRGWAGFVRERILEPLKIAPCLSTTELAEFGDVASGHQPGRNGPTVMPRYPIPEPNPAGSVFISARGLANWLRFQIGDGSWNDTRLVKSENLEETHKPQTIIPMNGIAKGLNPETVQLTYAMGWVVQDYRGVKVIGHSGWIDGFRVQLTLLPEYHLAFAILANLDGTRMNLALSNRIVDMLLDLPEKNWNAYFADALAREAREKQEAARRRAAARRPSIKPSLPLADYPGDYEHPAYGICKVRQKGGDLVWEWSSFKETLDHYEGDRFEIHEHLLGDSLATFQITDKKVTGLHVLGLDFKRRR